MRCSNIKYDKKIKMHDRNEYDKKKSEEKWTKNEWMQRGVQQYYGGCRK